MNSKLIKASLAGVAAIAVAAGGSTFAAWSDFGYLPGQEAGAGQLVLNLEGTNVQSQEPMNLAPGENEYRVFEILSNDGDSVPNGLLSMTLENVKNTEDGCTSNSEAVAETGDGNAPYAAGYNPATACGPATDGEFTEQAVLEIWQYGPSDNGQCSKVFPTSGVGSTVVQNRTIFNTAANVKKAVVELAPGDKTCVAMLVELDKTGARAANNAVQGDSASWDVRFDLDQV